MIISPSKYKILEKNGAGGMGEVYKAEDLELYRKVAIKVLKKVETISSKADLRFLREARLASKLNHPHIVTIYEIGETDDYAYIVMEYLKGHTLRQIIQSGAIKPDSVIKIGIQISDALIEAHSQGIIHRDIKPENILLTERGEVKVLDFGLAKKIVKDRQNSDSTSAESLTQSGAIIGTLSYMSPEQLRQEALDARTDIFSFGIMMYEMITGKLPFSGANSFDIAASILKDEAIEIGLLPYGFSQEIKPLTMRLLAKAREARPASFTEIKCDLELLNKKAVQQRASQETTLQVETGGWETTAELKAVSESQGESLHPAPSPVPFSQSPPTILVLPLEAVGTSEESAYIGIGLAHAITTNLAKIKGLSVLSKAAGAGLVGHAKRGAQDIARELGATILLEGEVMRAGNMIGVMARLINVESGRVLWGEQYRGDAAEIFSIQDSVCTSIALALRGGISEPLYGKPEAPLTINLAAFELYSKGRAYLDQPNVRENIDLAIQEFEKALKLDRNFALAQAGLGESYWQKYLKTREKSWVDLAITASDRALIIDSNQAEVHVSLGMIYRGTGKVEQAIEELQHAIELQPLQNEAYVELGRCYQQQGEFEKAVEHFEKAISIRPGYWNYYNLLGICYSTFGHYREAAEQFRRVISFQPANQVGYNNLGGIYLLLGKYEDALAMHQRSVNIIENHFAYSNIGTCYFYLGQYEKAIEAYQSALRLYPQNDIYHRNLGDTYLRLGRKEEAQKQFQTAIKLLEEGFIVNPNDAMSFARLAACKAKLGDKKEALEAIGRAQSIEPRNPEILYLHATVYALTGNSDKAIEKLNQALSSGYSLSEAERDLDLESIKDQENYKLLLKQFS